MTNPLDEAAGARDQIAAPLAAGIETISRDQEIIFFLYRRVVLPLDGFVFWVRANLMKPAALMNWMVPNTATTNQAVGNPKLKFKAKGSLHYTTDRFQGANEGFDVNTVVFTSLSPVDELNVDDPNSMYIGEFDGLRFGFSRRSSLYRQSQLYHYQGNAIYPSMEPQVIDSLASLSSLQVVSNSLPIWLTLNKFCPMYPSYLVPNDLTPPWCAVDIPPENTTALQMAPYLDPYTGSHYQLCYDRVKITTYGLRNSSILQFLDYVLSYAMNGGAFGIMNSPVPRDEKATQSELSTLAQKKSMEFEVNYYQTDIRNTALAFIRSAFINVIPEE